MNKTIHYHNKKIKILSVFNELPDTNTLVFETESKSFNIEHTIKTFLLSEKGQDIILLSNNLKNCFELLKKQFTYMEAAGGLIEQNKRFLFIKRLGLWDLPKGKIEKDESIEEAAIRECEEECGVSGLSIKQKLASTYHIYPFHNYFILKKTHWFKMKCKFSGALVPQTEEHIEAVEWLKIKDINERVMNNTYPAIKNLIIENIFNQD